MSDFGNVKPKIGLLASRSLRQKCAQSIWRPRNPKKFAHLLDVHGVVLDRAEPLNARVGKYVKTIEATYPLTDISRQIIKGSIGVFEKFNFVSNNKSLAHDNDLIGHAEAHFIFDSIGAILRFVKTIESGRFEA